MYGTTTPAPPPHIGTSNFMSVERFAFLQSDAATCGRNGSHFPNGASFVLGAERMASERPSLL